MSRYLLFVSISFAAALAGPGRSAGQDTLSLRRCRDLALEASPDIRAAGAAVRKADAERRAARAMRLPAVSATGLYAYVADNYTQEIFLPTYKVDLRTGELVPNVVTHPLTGDPILMDDGTPVFYEYGYFPLDISLKGGYMVGAKVEQPIYAGGKIEAGNRMAALAAEAARANVGLRRAEALAEAERAYWTLVSVREKVKLARAAVEMLDTIAAMAQAAADAGLARPAEVSRAKVARADAALSLQKAQSGAELARMALCRVAGLDPAAPVVPTDTLPAEADALADIGLLAGPAEADSLLGARPEATLLDRLAQIGREQERMARGDYLPTVGVSAGYTHMGGLNLSGHDISTGGFNAMAAVSIPLFHWGEGAAKAASARADADARALEAEKARGLMRLEVRQAQLALADAASRSANAREALAAAEENLRVARDGYELGAELLTDLLMSQTQWRQAYAEVIDAQADLALRRTLYLKATGRLDAPPGEQPPAINR